MGRHEHRSVSRTALRRVRRFPQLSRKGIPDGSLQASSRESCKVWTPHHLRGNRGREAADRSYGTSRRRASQQRNCATLDTTVSSLRAPFIDVEPLIHLSGSRPYDAVQDEEGWIWARGATDCKNTLVGILSAFEKLALEGFEPSRSIILSSGFDEEIGGRRSAPLLANILEERYGRDGVAFIIDEGISGVFEAFKQTFVVFAVAEKGFVNLKIEVHTPGGKFSRGCPRRCILIGSNLSRTFERSKWRPYGNRNHVETRHNSRRARARA